MVEPRHRLPLKKVRLQHADYNLYAKNRSQLQRIPGVFMLLLVVLAIGGFIWYFDFFGLRKPADVVLTSSSTPLLVGTQSSSSSSDPVDIVETDTLLQLTSSEGKKCVIEYSKSPLATVLLPSYLPSKIGWWVAGSQCNSGLQQVAIFRLTNEEKSTYFNNVGNNLQQLDDNEPQTYALLFSSNSTSTYTFRDEVKALTLPIFQDRIYFKPSKAIAQINRGSGVFYLDGRCTNTGIESCSLWYKNAQGEFSRINSSVIPNQQDASISFATNQPTNTDQISIQQKSQLGIILTTVTINVAGQVIE